MRTLTETSLVCWLAFGAFFVTCRISPANAHQFSFAQGTAIVGTNHVNITLEFNGEDLRHIDGEPPPDEPSTLTTWIDDASKRHGLNILNRFIVRDIDGNSISGRAMETNVRNTANSPSIIASLRDVRIAHSLSFPLSDSPCLLTFQQTSDVAISLRSQWVLAVRVDGDERERIVRLTSQGNTETLEFDWPIGKPHPRSGLTVPPDSQDQSDPASSRFPSFVEERMRDEKYRTMFAVIHTADQETTLDIYAPLTLVETFVPTSRRNHDYVEVDEQVSIAAAWLTLVASRIEITNDDEPIPAIASSSSLLSPTASHSGSAPESRRLSAYATRTHVKLSFSNSAGPIDLNWKLFNNAILTVPLFVENEKETTTAELTTYSPKFRLDPTKP